MEYSGTGPFEVRIIDEILTVHPQEDESYQVFRGDTLLATLWPRLNESGVIWEADDFIASDYVQQIGQMIAAHHSGMS